MDTLVSIGPAVPRAADFLTLHLALTDGNPLLPLPVPARWLDGGAYGLLLVDGDTCPRDQFAVITGALFEFLKSPERPRPWKTIYVLYLFVDTGSVDVAPVLACESKSTFLGYRVQSGYYDATRGVGTLPKDHGIEPQILRVLKENLSREKLAVSPEVHAAAILLEQERMTKALATLSQGTVWGTWLVVSVCLLMFAWTCAWSGLGTALEGKGRSIQTVLQLGGNYAPFVLAGEWWRLWASTFLHFGILHLALNMQGLISVGPILERLLGTRGYLALYAVAGMTGSLASTFYHASNPTVAAGASGAIFGVFGAVAYVVWRRQDEFPASLRQGLSGGMVPCIGYNLLFGLRGGVDNAAHIGGLVGGVIVAALLTTSFGSRVRMSGALLVIGLLPFVNQVYAGAHAIRHMNLETSPAVTYHDPQGRFSLEHPDQLHPEAIADGEANGACGVRLMGEGLLFVVIVTPPEPGITLKTATDTFEKEVKDRVDRRESRRMGSIDWALGYGTSAQDQKICNAIGLVRDQTVVVRVTTVNESLDEASRALPGLLGSIQVPARK